MDSNSELDSNSEYDLQSFFESSEDEESYELSSELSSKPSSKPSSGTSTPRLKHPRPKHSIGARIQAVNFFELDNPHQEITRRTGISTAQLYKLWDKAISQGWDPKVSGIVEVSHVEDAIRSGRLKTSQAISNLVLKTITQNSTTQGWSCARIAHEVSSTPNTP
jgi:hypothetical protein